MRVSRPFAWLAVVLVALVGAPASCLLLKANHENEPFCHKGLNLAIYNYLYTQKMDLLPNVDGRSAESLRVLDRYMGDEVWEGAYRYVPGLRKGDPGDLVVAYMTKPTRYRMHDDPVIVFNEKKWMAVPIDFMHNGPGKWVEREVLDWGEDSERLTLDEFRSRLKKTLDFLRDNERPNWQTVVEENEAFLKSIEEPAKH
jgi:hypothetical protein